MFTMTGFLTSTIVFSWFLLNFSIHNMLVLGYTKNIKRLIDIEQIKNSTQSSGLKSGKCDFHGVKLKTVTGKSVPYLMTEPEYEKTTVFNSKTQTYDITNHCNGLMKDIVETLAATCNFTYEIHIRKDTHKTPTQTTDFTLHIEQEPQNLTLPQISSISLLLIYA